MLVAAVSGRDEQPDLAGNREDSGEKQPLRVGCGHSTRRDENSHADAHHVNLPNGRAVDAVYANTAPRGTANLTVGRVRFGPGVAAGLKRPALHLVLKRTLKQCADKNTPASTHAVGYPRPDEVSYAQRFPYCCRSRVRLRARRRSRTAPARLVHAGGRRRSGGAVAL